VLDGFTRSWANALNNQGAVVGNCDRGDERFRAFVHRDGRLHDLTALLPANAGWTLERANDINARGQIVGYGLHNGVRRAFLLTPAEVIADNRPPLVTIVSPLNGQIFAGPTNLLIAATVDDPDGASTVHTVEFLANNVSLGVTTNSLQPEPEGPFHLQWQNVFPGEYLLTAVATDEFGAKTTSTPIRITLEGEPPVGPQELHVVGVYSGAAADGGPVHNHEVGDAAVTVNRPGQRVSLFLLSYEPTHWHVTAEAGTVLERIFVSAYYSSTVEGTPPGAQLVFTNIGYAFTMETPGYYQILPRICAVTGQEMASFQGRYSAPYPAPFLIDEVQDDPRLRCNYPQPETNNLPALEFQVAFYNSTGIYTRNFTASGPTGGGSTLPDIALVPDATGRYYYSADPHYVWQVDGLNGTVRELVLPPDIEELSWPMGAAYDSHRDRVLLVSLGGEGFLYSYAPSDDSWTVLTSMNNLDLDSLVYHQATDRLFAVQPVYNGAARLQELTPDGAPQRSFPLVVLPFEITPGGYRSELVSVGEYLVWLLAPRYLSHSPQETRMYLLDPRTGEVRLTYRQLLNAPNIAPHVALIHPLPNAKFLTNEPVTLVATASDPDGGIARVMFRLNGSWQGPAAGPNGAPFGEWRLALGTLPPGNYEVVAQATDNSGATATSGFQLFQVQAQGDGEMDSDGDGVLDALDQCPNTAPNALVNRQGCSLEQLCPCDTFDMHRQYVRCVIDNAWDFFRQGLLSEAQRREAINNAVHSECGRGEGVRLELQPQNAFELAAEGRCLVLCGLWEGPGAGVLECSTNLVHWTPIATNAPLSIGVELADPAGNRPPARFYRLRIVP
jgi:probable HAF family extracellular repeat protein